MMYDEGIASGPERWYYRLLWDSDREWVERAACQGMDTEKFFPEYGDGGSKQTKALMKMCKTQCPVQAECLEYAIVTNQKGIWGGTTPADRNKIRKERNLKDGSDNLL